MTRTAKTPAVVVAAGLLSVLLGVSAVASGPRVVEVADFADQFAGRLTVPPGVAEVSGMIADASDRDFFRAPIQIQPTFPIISEFSVRFDRSSTGDGTLLFSILDDNSNLSNFVALGPGQSVEVTGSALFPDPVDRTRHFVTIGVTPRSGVGSGGYSVRFTPVPIPEPATLVSLTGALLLVGMQSARRLTP